MAVLISSPKLFVFSMKSLTTFSSHPLVKNYNSRLFHPSSCSFLHSLTIATFRFGHFATADDAQGRVSQRVEASEVESLASAHLPPDLAAETASWQRQTSHRSPREERGTPRATFLRSQSQHAHFSARPSRVSTSRQGETSVDEVRRRTAKSERDQEDQDPIYRVETRGIATGYHAS